MTVENGLASARALCAQQRTAISLLFCDGDMAAMTQAAAELSAWLLCAQPQADQACGHCAQCLLSTRRQHPDLVWLAPKQAGAAITIEAVRELKEKISLKPYQGRCVVAVITEAQRLRAEAANALLKTLEEPPPDAVIIVVAASSRQLLPTIVSRCQMVRFATAAAAAPPDIEAALAQMFGEMTTLAILHQRYQEWTRWERAELEALFCALAHVFADIAVLELGAATVSHSGVSGERLRVWQSAVRPGAAPRLSLVAADAAQAIRGNANSKMTVDRVLRAIQDSAG